jgi:hypothetical protein
MRMSNYLIPPQICKVINSNENCDPTKNVNQITPSTTKLKILKNLSSLPVSSTIKEEVEGVPMPIRVKYSPLPWERPEMTGLVIPEPERGLALELRLGLGCEFDEASDETREKSRERRRRKVSSGVELEGKRESRCAMRSWREVAEVVSRVRVSAREECETGAGFCSGKRCSIS